MISPPEHGEFASAIQRVVGKYRPQCVIETGTHLGTGTTKILHDSLSQYSKDFTLITIESNRESFNSAAARWLPHPEVVCLHGLSIPKSMLPTREQIKALVIDEQIPGIYYDHDIPVRVDRYLAEQATDGPDSLLRVALSTFRYKPDLVLLDSAGHLGWLEFQYLMSLVKGPFVLVCDDGPGHVKHHSTFKTIHLSKDWDWLDAGDERFGWFAARFKGSETPPAPETKGQ